MMLCPRSAAFGVLFSAGLVACGNSAYQSSASPDASADHGSITDAFVYHLPDATMLPDGAVPPMDGASSPLDATVPLDVAVIPLDAARETTTSDGRGDATAAETSTTTDPDANTSSETGTTVNTCGSACTTSSDCQAWCGDTPVGFIYCCSASSDGICFQQMGTSCNTDTGESTPTGETGTEGGTMTTDPDATGG